MSEEQGEREVFPGSAGEGAGSRVNLSGSTASSARSGSEDTSEGGSA